MLFQESIIQDIGHVLQERKETIAVAESVTSGYLQLAFSQIHQASSIYKGGITTYTMAHKIKLLHIDPAEADNKDCVSPAISGQMAKKISTIFDVDWAIATTGYATPVEESGFKQFAFGAIFYKGQEKMVKEIGLMPHTNPIDAQHFYAEAILYELHALLLPGL